MKLLVSCLIVIRKKLVALNTLDTYELQCPSNKDEPVIATYHRGNYAHLGMKEVEQFVSFMAAYELNTFIDQHETCPIASQYKDLIVIILNICRNEFDENIYVIDTTKRAIQERSDVLQEEDDENISLEEEVCEEDDKSLSLGMWRPCLEKQ